MDAVEVNQYLENAKAKAKGAQIRGNSHKIF